MFKNLIFFRITEGWSPSLESASEALQAYRFAECGATQESSTGWVEPRGEKHAPLVESFSGQWILRVMSESKLLPASVVREALEERCEAIETQAGRKPGRKEIAELRDQVRQELLSKAFTKKSASFVWVDPVGRFVAIDASSQSKADSIVTLLVKTFDGLCLRACSTEQSPAAAMAAWLASEEPPQNFTADKDCSLKASDESKSCVKYAKHPLDIDEVKAHIIQGKTPTQLAMTWNSRVSFVLTDAFALKKIEFLDVVFSGEAEGGFDADAAIATGEFKMLLPDLLTALGGEVAHVGSDQGSEQETDIESLLPRAREVLLANNTASISGLQRLLRIRYNVAAQILERLEQEGFVSPMSGNGQRKLLAEQEEMADQA